MAQPSRRDDRGRPAADDNDTSLMLFVGADVRLFQQRTICRLFPAGVGADSPDAEECAGRVASLGP